MSWICWIQCPMWTLSRASMPSPAAADLGFQNYACIVDHTCAGMNASVSFVEMSYDLIQNVIITCIYNYRKSHSVWLKMAPFISIILFTGCFNQVSGLQDMPYHTTSTHVVIELPWKATIALPQHISSSGNILLEIDIKWDHIKQYLLQTTAAGSCGNMPTYANEALLLSKIHRGLRAKQDGFMFTIPAWPEHKIAGCSKDLFVSESWCKNFPHGEVTTHRPDLVNKHNHQYGSFHFTVPSHLVKQSLRSCNLQVPQPSKFIRLTQGDVQGSKQRWPQWQPWLPTGHMEFAGWISTLEIKNSHEHP